MNVETIVTGERLQSIAHVYIGTPQRFYENPIILKHTKKHFNINTFSNVKNHKINNQQIIFCYGDFLLKFHLYVHLFINPFILISHNSDENITHDKPFVFNILNCDKLIKWYAQNVCVKHEKLEILPIGIANSKWEHGNLDIYSSIFEKEREEPEYIYKIKTEHIFMNFKAHTNPYKRVDCFQKLSSKIPFLKDTTHFENISRMANYKFCICPEGNGVDSHRIWECYYLKVIPIMLKNEFTEILQEKTQLPMILINDWNELNIEQLPDYEDFKPLFSKNKHILTMDYWREHIINSLS